MCEVEIYNLIGNGRNCPSYQPTAVYKGRLKDSIEFVAIKLIDMQRQDEILNAVDLLKNLQHHDNIVDFIDCAENYNSDSKSNSGKINFNSSINSRNRGQTNQIRLVVEYCPGGTLMELLERDVSLPESVIQIFASDILSAFLHLHKNEIIYRDISPRNILLDECGLIKLGDFSRSGRIGDSIDFSIVDPEMLQYMSPELLDEDPCPSFSSDFYSLGCIMYQMATGHSPFPIPLTPDGQDIDEMKLVDMIRDYQPVSLNNPIPDVSKEFNDLLIKLLDKDPYKRPNWLEIVTHPFWKESLTTERLDNSFVDFQKTYKSLPKQERFEKKRQQLQESMTNSSKKSQTNNINTINNTNFNRSSLVRSSLKSLTDKTPEQPKEQKSQTNNIENISASSSLATPTPSIRDLLLKSSLFQTSQLALNINILDDDLPSLAGVALPISANSLRSSNVEDVDTAVSKLNSIFSGPDKSSKVPILSFLIAQSKSPEIAENLSNSMLLSQLPQFAIDSKNNQISSLFLTLFGSLISNSTIIYKAYIKEEKVDLIEKLCSSPNDLVMAKAVACIGELISFVVRTNENNKANENKKNSSPFTISSNLLKIIVNGLSSKNDIVKHICLKTVTNALLSTQFTDFFEPTIIEESLSKFNKVNNMSIVDSFAICTALFFIKNKATSLDFPSSLARQLITTSPNDSVICQPMGIAIATATDTLLAMREPILDIFSKSQNPNLSHSNLLSNSGLLYEAKVKSFLALPIIYKDHQLEFVDISARFFAMLEKYEYNDNLYVTLNSTQSSGKDLNEAISMNDISDAVTTWSVSFCETAVDSVVVGADFDLLQIVYNAIQIKSLAQRIWTNKFENKIRKIVRNTTFNSNKSEIALQLIQCALCYNLCEISIITELFRALNSQQESIRFTVLKLVADATSLHDDKIIEFVESHIINQLQSLLQDQSFISDQTLRILSNSADIKPSILKNIVKAQTLSLIFTRIVDNSAAISLAKHIIDLGYVSIDVLISARLVPAILSTMEKRDIKDKNGAKISASPSVNSNKGGSQHGNRIGSSLSNQSIPDAVEPQTAAVESALSLLLVTLKMIERKLTEVKGNQARRNIIKSINTLASLTPKTAVLLLEHPNTAGKCFCSLVKVFEPQGTQNEVLIDSSLHPFSISLSQGCRKQENAPILIEALKTLQWAAENSSAVRLRLKGAGTLMSSIKKAADYGATDELKAVAISCQKVIKG